MEPIDQPRGFPAKEWFGGEYAYNRFSGENDTDRLSDCGGWHVHTYDPGDCHSATWLTTAEIAVAQKRYLEASGSPSSDIAMALMIMRTAESFGFEDVRLLCCFDN